MKEEIEELKNQVKKLEAAYEIEQAQKYEASEHKHFDIGDIVSNGKQIGIVGWTENKGINISYDRGYMGISLINGSRGFMAPTKRDEYSLVTDEYYNRLYDIRIQLTGLEIEDLKYVLGYRNCNHNNTKSKFLDVLETIRPT